MDPIRNNRPPYTSMRIVGTRTKLPLVLENPTKANEIRDEGSESGDSEIQVLGFGFVLGWATTPN